MQPPRNSQRLACTAAIYEFVEKLLPAIGAYFFGVVSFHFGTG
jgi:hypothetical protein